MAIKSKLLRKPYSQLTVQRSLHSSANEYKDIVKEGYDLAILINQLDDSTLIMWRISTGRLRLFANTTYLKTAGEPKAIADLTSHTLLCMAHCQNEVT